MFCNRPILIYVPRFPRPPASPVAHACPVDAEAAARYLRRVDPGDGGIAWIWSCGHEAPIGRKAPRVERCPWCGVRLRQAPRSHRERQQVALSALYVLVTAGAAPGSGMGPRVLDLARHLAMARGREERRVRRDVAGLVHGYATLYMTGVRRACATATSTPRLLGLLRSLWILVSYGGKRDAMAEELVELGRALGAGKPLAEISPRVCAWIEEHADTAMDRMKEVFSGATPA